MLNGWKVNSSRQVFCLTGFLLLSFRNCMKIRPYFSRNRETLNGSCHKEKSEKVYYGKLQLLQCPNGSKETKINFVLWQGSSSLLQKSKEDRHFHIN